MTNETEKDLIINHIHPLKEKVVALEKGLEYQEKMVVDKFEQIDKRMVKTEVLLETMAAAIKENHDLVKKMWSFMWGITTCLIVVWAVFKFISPFIK